MAVFSESDDFAGTRAGALRLAPGDVVAGTLSSDTDIDAFRISAELGFDYRISVTRPDGSEIEGDVTLFALDEDGNGLSLRGGFLPGTQIVLNAADLGFFGGLGDAPRDFTVFLGDEQGLSPPGPYRLAVEREEGSTAATPISIAAGESIEGAWQYRGDTDLIGLEVEAGRTYAVSIDIFEEQAMEGGLLTLGSRDIDLRGPDGGVRGSFVDIVGSSAFGIDSFRFEATETGSYFLETVNDSDEFANLNFGAETGGYRVTLIEDEPADRTSPLRFEVGTPVVSRFDFVSDEDWWGVDLQGGVTYDVFFGAESEDGPTGSFVEIFDASGAEVFQIDSPRPPSLSDPIPPVDGTFTPGSDGLYFFSPIAFGRVGPYRLEVSAPGLLLEGRDDRDDALDGAAGNDTILGRDRDDTLRGFGGSDEIAGEGGDDTLEGGAGDDTLDGGDGVDRMVGGPGDDVIVVDDPGDRVAAGDGVDTVRTSVDFVIRGTGVERVEAVGGGNLRVTGTAAAERFDGGDGRETLIGFGGADTMTGGGGDDFFVIVGRRGVAPEVTITDFSGGDRLAIDDQLLGLGRAGIDVRDLTFDVVRGLLREGTVSYSGRTGELAMDLDGAGPGGRQVVAVIEGGGRLGIDDVLLF